MRLALPEDRELFFRLVEAKSYPSGPVLNLSGVSRQKLLLEAYRRIWDNPGQDPTRFFIADDRPGFMVVLPHQRESLTGQLQDEILDWGGEWQPLVARAGIQASQAGSEYLVARVYPSEEQLFVDLGFAPELTRVVKKVEKRSFEGPFNFRLAGNPDRLFIANLNSQGLQFYVPDHRGIDAEALSAKMMNRYLSLELGPDSNFLGILITEGRRPFGYILLRLGEQLDHVQESAAYVYDLNLRAEYWGRKAGRLLGNYTQSLLVERNIPYLVGDISRANEHALLVAVDSIGFESEWVRWGKRVAH